jgi:hypothetical protein
MAERIGKHEYFETRTPGRKNDSPKFSRRLVSHVHTLVLVHNEVQCSPGRIDSATIIIIDWGLMYAAAEGRTNVVNLLLDRGASINGSPLMEKQP